MCCGKSVFLRLAEMKMSFVH